ncbi:MAG: hypothetical protein IKV75_02220 [Bacteroidales bacterium]|nr:hypothetical protein [Bacteroidales bacterium]
MKNIFKYSALLACLAIIGLVSCTQEELSTDQYDDGIVTLAAFGPNPVVRGDTLTILGSNLEKVKEVQLPGVDPITEFAEVVPGAKAHIKVLVPVEGPEDAPVSGLVSIVDENGTVFSSTTELSYTEGIKIASFSPAEALPGDIVTIRGEYLYNVREVVFVSGNAKGKTYVTGDAITASRYELKVAVPADAISGLIMLADVDEIADPDALPNTTYTATEITIKDPEVTAFAQKTFKAGDKVDITGAYLNMMQTVKFAGADVDVADFTVSADGKKLTVTLPATANDGAVTAVSYAGKEFPAGEIVTVRPTELAVAAETRYKAGLNVIVTGKDLDLVTEVNIAGVKASFSTTATKATVTLPAESADGEVVLSLANKNTVTAGSVVVVKPVIESLSATTVVAGGEIVVTGKDLDLATEVAVSGQACEFELEEQTLKVKISKAAYTGKLVVTAANKCTSEADLEVTYQESVSIEYPEPVIKLGSSLTINGTGLMQIESISIKDNKVTDYMSRTDSEMTFALPEGIKSPGLYNLSLVLISGETLTWAVPFEVTAPYTETFIWEGSEALNWTGMQALAWGGYDWSTVEAGTVLVAYFDLDPSQEYWQVRFANGSWTSLPSGVEIATSLGQGDGNIPMSLGMDKYEITLTEADLNCLVNEGGLVMTGANYTLKGIALKVYGATETVIWEGPADPQNYAVNLELGGDDNSDWRNADLQVGQTIKIYFDLVDPASWSIQIFDAHWHGMLSFPDPVGGQFNQGNWDASLGYVSFEVTEKILSEFTVSENWGKSIILQGAGLTFTKITLQ